MPAVPRRIIGAPRDPLRYMSDADAQWPPARPTKFAWSSKRVMGKAAASLVPIPNPRVVSGAGALRRMGELAKELGVTKPLIVTDKILVKLGVVQPCIDSLAAAGLDSAVFDDVVPNPHSELVEAGHARYVDAGCDAIIAFGGGSPMDCAKVIGAKVCNPKPLEKYAKTF